jgi:hypothetical protein
MPHHRGQTSLERCTVLPRVRQWGGTVVQDVGDDVKTG